MSTVDNRVVRMTFDNAQFEQGIKTTKKSIEDFEKALKLDGATAGFDELSKATDKLDLSGLSKKANAEATKVSNASADAAKSIGKISDVADNTDMSGLSKAANVAVNDVNNAAMGTDLAPITKATSEASEGFNAFGTVATGVLFGIGESISELITGGLGNLARTIENFTIKPIAEGFSEYEAQIGSIQTILANTGMDFDSDDDIDRVNTALDELNTYADETIYKFGDMTEAIGTFTSAGLELDAAVSAVKGVSNVAAFSGASASDVHRVLPQISQALSAGTVNMMDWRSIETAHMASRGFVEAIGDMAVHMAKVNKASNEAAEAGQALIDKQVTMRNALNKQDNKAWSDWFNSDILAETFKVFTFDLRSATADEKKAMEDHLAELGYQADEYQKIFDRAKMATRSATEVRTWTQLWDTVGESIGSNWAGIWRNLIGDFKQATDTFTFLSNTISGAIDSLLGGIVNSALMFNKSGAIDLIFGGFARDNEGSKIYDEITNEAVRIKGALDYLVEAIGKPLGAIKDAFDEVFHIDNDTLVNMLVGTAMAIQDFAKSLVISDDAATGLRQIFEGLFSVLDIGIRIVLDIGAAFFGLLDIVRTITDPLIDIALALGGQVGRALLWFHDRFLEVRAAIIDAMQPFFEVIEIIKGIVSAFFDFSNIPGQIQNFGDMLLGLLDVFWKFIDIPGIIRGIGDVIKGIFGWVGDLTGWNAAVKESNELFNATGQEVSALDIWIGKLLQNPIIAFFKSIADFIGGAIVAIRDFIVGVENVEGSSAKITLPIIFESIKSAIMGAITPIGDFVTSLGGAFLTIFDLVGKLLGAIGGFAQKVGEALMAWEPLKNVIDMLNTFKDGAINFFLDLPNKLSGVSNGIEGSIGGIQGAFGVMFDWLNGAIDYFSNVTVEQFISDVKNFANGVIENVMSIINYFTTTSPAQVFEDFTNSVSGFFTNFQNTLSGWASNLDSIFPGIGTTIQNGLSVIFTNIQNGIGSVRDFLLPVFQESDSIPEFFINLFIKIGSAIADGFNSIVETISKFNPSTVAGGFDSLTNFFLNGAKKLEDTFPALNGSLTGGISSASSSIKQFFSDITGDATTWGELFTNVFNNIGEQIQKVPGMIFDALGFIRDRIAEGITWIFDRLEGLHGPLGDFFGNFRTTLESIEAPISTAIEWIKNLFNTLKDFLFGKLPSESPMSNVISGVSLDGYGNGVGGIIDDAKSMFTDKFSKLSEFILSIPERINELCNRFLELISNPEVIINIVSIIKDILVGRLLWSLNDLIKGLGNLADVGAKYIKKEKITGLSEKFKDIAIGFGIIAVAIGIISMIPDPTKAVITLGEVAVVIIALEAISAVLTKWAGEGVGDQLIKAMGSIGVFAAGLLLMMYTIEQLNNFDIEANIKGIKLAGELIGGLALIAIAISKVGGDGGKNFISAAAGIVILVAGLNMLIPVLEQCINVADNIKPDKLQEAGVAIAVLAGFMVAMGGSLRLAGDHAISSGVGFLLLASSLDMIADTIIKTSIIASLNMPALIASVVSLGIIVGEFAIIANKTKAGDLAGTALSIGIFSSALMIMGEALSRLAEHDWTQIALAGASIAGILAIFYGMTANLNAIDLAGSAGGIALYGASLAIIATVLKQLSEVDSVALWNAVGALSGLTIVFGYVSMAPGLITAGLAMDAFALALIGIATAILMFQDAVVNSPSFEQFKDAGYNVVAGFGEGILMGIGHILEIIVNFGQTILNAILEFFGINSPSLLMQEEVGQYIPAGIAEGMLGGEGNMMDVLSQIFGNIMNSLQEFITGLPEWFSTTGMPMLSNLVTNVWTWFTTSGIPMLGQILSSFWNWATTQALPKLGEFIGMIFNKLGELISKFAAWMGSDGLPALGKALGDFWNWVTTQALPKLGEFIVGIFGKLGELISKFAAWMGSDGLPALGKALGDFWNWVTTQALPKLGEFIVGIFGKLGELVGQFFGWLGSDGIGMLGEAIGSFWNWVTGEALPKLGEFIVGIFAKLGEIPGMLGHWIISDMLPAIGDALSGIIDKAGELGGMLIDWIGGIPGYIEDGITFVWSKITEVGDYIAQGIAEGLDNGIEWITNSITGLGNSAIEGIKNFFGIDSPSKLMRDEVGQYIPAGVAEGIRRYASVAEEAGRSMGKDTLDGVNNALNDSRYSLTSPTITPVVDMDLFNQRLKAYRLATTNMLDANSYVNGTVDIWTQTLEHGLMDSTAMLAAKLSDNDKSLSQHIAEQIDYSSRLNDNVRSDLYKIKDNLGVIANGNANTLKTLDSQLSNILDAANAINDAVANGKNIYMDSGALVGAIVPEVDSQLGRRQNLAARGMY